MPFELPPGVPLSKIPAAVPPPGLTSNFNNPPTLERAITAVGSTMTLLTLFFVIIRLHLHLRTGHNFGLDDYFCYTATVLTFAYTGMILSRGETYRHSWDLPLSSYGAEFFKKEFAQGMVMGPAMFFAKASLLLLYLRIFRPKKSTCYWIYFGLAFTFCLYWINVPFDSYYCAPSPGGSWGDFFSISIKCNKAVYLGLVQGSLSIALDLFILILPIPVVMTLQMSSKKRAGALAVLMTGLFAVVASILGLAFRVRMYLNGDAWDRGLLFLCIIIETHVAIICISMPSFAAFSRTYLANPIYLATLRARIASRFTSPKSKAQSLPKPVSYPSSGPIKTRGISPLDSFAGSHDDEAHAQSDRHTNAGQAGVPDVHAGVDADSLRKLEEGTMTTESLELQD